MDFDFDALQEVSNSYAEKATKLSDYLVFVENCLKSLKGKIVVTKCTQRYRSHLTFKRIGNDWGLFFYAIDGKDWQRVISAPVDIKIQAVKLLPELLNDMLYKQKLINDALTSLEFPNVPMDGNKNK